MGRISRLKVEIVRRGLVQADVAQEAGISESRLSRIINGRVRPFDHEIRNLATVLDMQKDNLPV